MTEVAPKTLDPTIEPLFRQLSGQLTATLTRILGTLNIDTAEAIVQDAFLKALEVWPYKGVPENPAGWITTVAKNLAIDTIRRDARRERFAPAIARQYEEQIIKQFAEDGSIRSRFADDQLQMMLLTCHPTLTRRSQVMLTLRLAGGLSVSEIARAFLSIEENVRKLITRAKKTLRDIDDPFEWPSRDQIDARIGVVLEVLYAIFNEGYSLTDEEVPIRSDLCDESIRLCRVLLSGSREFTNTHTVAALLALMLLHSSRIPARVNDSNELVLLPDQDRSKWDSARINQGLWFLRESIGGTTLSEYHLEAQIAGAHTVAKDYNSTDWVLIVNLYDKLFEMTGNPVIGLNRAVAIAEAQGIEAGLTAIRRLDGKERLENYHLYFAALADLHRRAGNVSEAVEFYRRALSLVPNDLERTFIRKRIDEAVENQFKK